MVNNIIKTKNKPHALLLVESKLCDLNGFIKQFIKSIVTIEDNDEWSKKVDLDTYYDIIKVNGYKTNIKKEEVTNVISQFSKTAVENRGIKFYIVYGIEFATPQAINSLLKFLEEPPIDTYAILTTRALNLVLPTIRSRCQTYILKSDIHGLETKLATFDLNAEQLQLITKVYYNYEDVIEDIENDVFNSTYTLVSELMNHKNHLGNIKRIQEEFSKFDYKRIQLMLKMLIALKPNNEKLFKQLENLHVNPVKILLFNNIWTILQGES